MQFLFSLDRALFHLINVTLANPFFDVFFPTITDLHKTDVFRLVFVPFLLVLWFYLYRLRGVIIFLFLFVSMGMADWFGALLKHRWSRARPFVDILDTIQRSDAGGYSFPSNHAINMFCMAFFLSSFFPRFRFLFFMIAVLVAFSRIYNGVHYPSDVLAGMMIGSVFGIFGSLLARQVDQSAQYLLKRKKKRRNV
jgi:undecaprenyl-diphosphatase